MSHTQTDSLTAEPRVHICRPRGYYIGQVRSAGFRHWQKVTGRCTTAEKALAKAVLRMNGHKRARALFVDTSGWYGPHVAMEARDV